MARTKSKSKTKTAPTERAGPFTPQEVLYVEQVAEDFRRGLIDDVPHGTHLRQYLSMLLRCQPMRLSKRFIMSSNTLGLCIYNDAWYDGTTDKAAAAARREALRIDFEQSVLASAPYVPTKKAKPSKKAPERTLPARQKKRKAIVVSYPENEFDLGDHIGRMSIHRLLASTTKKKRRVSTQEAMHLMSFARRLRDKVAAEPPVVVFEPPTTQRRTRSRAKVEMEKTKRKRSHTKRRTSRPWDSSSASSADEAETAVVARPWEAPYRDLKALEFSFRKRTRSAVSYNEAGDDDDDGDEPVAPQAPAMQPDGDLSAAQGTGANVVGVHDCVAVLVENASHTDDELMEDSESPLVADDDGVMATPVGAPSTTNDDDDEVMATDAAINDDAVDDESQEGLTDDDEPAFAAFAPSASDAYLALETVDLDSFEAMDFEHNLFEKVTKIDVDISTTMDAFEMDILTDLSSDLVELEAPSVVAWTL